MPALPTALAKPVFVTVAMVVSDDVHVTEEVMSLTDPSPNVPVAANCCEPWVTVMVGFCGLIANVLSGDVTTDTVVEPEMPFMLAVIVAEPEAMALAMPVLLM